MSTPTIDKTGMQAVRKYLLCCEHSVRCVYRVIDLHRGCTCGLSAALRAAVLTASEIVRAGLPAWQPDQETP